MELGNLCFGNSRGVFPVDRSLYQQVFAPLFEILDITIGDSWGYAPNFENDVFFTFPYYWGDCTCGFAEAEEEWETPHPHTKDCYQVFAAVIGLACLFDRHTGWSYYRGLDSQVEVLEQLHELSLDDIEENSTLRPLYLGIIDQALHSKDRVGISHISSTQEKNPYLTTLS
jgi:hypothetical protein